MTYCMHVRSWYGRRVRQALPLLYLVQHKMHRLHKFRRLHSSFFVHIHEKDSP